MVMDVMIGVDPHKGSHTATMLDRAERELTRIKVRAGRGQLAELLEWADGHTARAWAVESAGGMVIQLPQQLVAAGETVLNVPATLASRVRCWARASRPRATRTTPTRWRSPRCGRPRLRFNRARSPSATDQVCSTAAPMAHARWSLPQAAQETGAVAAVCRRSRDRATSPGIEQLGRQPTCRTRESA
jgi:hypothetical protein